MKFLLLPHVPSQDKSDEIQLLELVENAVLAEELGFDGYGVGERHDRPAVSSSPPVLLAHIAARTSAIRLFTAVTTLGMLDPLRAFEDYSTLDNLSGGRLDLMIGKGGYPRTSRLFDVTADDQWALLQENYALFRRLWESGDVTWKGELGRSLDGAEALPRPLQRRLRVWHGSATSPESADFAARCGDPIFSSNGRGRPEPYAELIRHYRDRWDHYGHDPADALVGIGTSGYFGAKTSQEAVAKYRAVFEARLAVNRRYDGGSIRYSDVDEWVEQSSVLVGSPQQIIDKVHAQHALFGHEALHVHVDAEILGAAEHRATLELFFSEIAPVLRRELPSRPLAAGR
ncbi:alkanesulfonate monooxygenase SsuD/methylene tetrahydromethanopterin reductase-like flavin-dependent oxidoreductase (luciferase family) [Actinocorallia herbida]|uniref:Alkanesulfonate monooxygenase SsuD/methylene tetrahydromethanopterin reductase-like flavin-dependent oxidoreductase (Luciferase family) n=1 Tax=Actinocorallia herbida TaxID=58109 RepID=A0A3N1CX90_9ACTN|nr:LLM class flavin-dependent oxidoreductase [Actinocorallia herbida]ROO85866.1 alkanesulfonate monooxygenase SsuD/methylene tetrahydromethanopterin reductase-like flavin-dependent oxidoreductase (luciferase family) [Actinocorallia herbida]